LKGQLTGGKGVKKLERSGNKRGVVWCPERIPIENIEKKKKGGRRNDLEVGIPGGQAKIVCA